MNLSAIYSPNVPKTRILYELYDILSNSVSYEITDKKAHFNEVSDAIYAIEFYVFRDVYRKYKIDNK
jgi:hypothetical protein